ncbi:L-idonate 5-dehydrogenase [Roseibium sp. TrichSKD4]|uniref:L-idonate 5-dehydrogenase n=1 Tax=Roseibium sp. TrichSKD4 TaxID=744980 RepID=UPI0001E56F15|nr:L-idonate 5-dehydrogenase [Roseibium sp. TrichSKD4]EFO32065.1 L-idonate 5-dehydrogenase [Roseibium sp. TrichSKD4]
MKAIVIHAAKDLRVEEQETAAPGAGEVEIELATGGICGSDLHYYNHGGFGAIRLREPMILGHEVSGYIRRLGPGVADLSEGQLVSVSPSRPCGECSYCQNGQQNHCLNMRFYGSAMPFPHIQGAFRQTLVANTSQIAVADGLSAGEAAMAEPLAVCLHAAKQAGDLLGRRVLVTGSGPIGALCILLARRAGAAEIVATDLSDFTLGIAQKVGADRAINMASTPNGLADYEKNKGYFDVVFECTGAAPALASGVACLKPGGTLIQLGLGGDMNVPLQALTAKEITLRGSFRFHQEFFTGVEMMRNGLIDVKSLITHTLPLEDSVAAFELASDRSQAMKAQISFN